MSVKDLLILRRPEIDERFPALGLRLSEDPALRELYVRGGRQLVFTTG